jgi:endo-1,4-beta-D-glucanase Y
MIDQGRYLKPGSWGGAKALNPGYFSPAWYRIFATRDSVSSHDWNAVVEQSYQTILAGPGAGMGLVCDWSDGQGQPLTDGPGYNAFAKGHWFYKDAVRVLWRLALDYAWFGDVRAKRFLDSAAAFIKTPANADFFQISGKHA